MTNQQQLDLGAAHAPPIKTGAPESQSLAASFVPASMDPKKRTIDCVAYSGAKIPRMDYWTGEAYDLTLSLDAAAVRLDRMNNGAPVCDAHNTYSCMGQPGVVEQCWIENGQLRASLRFSQNPEIDAIWSDVQNGIIRNVSIGAWIYTKRDVTAQGDPRQQFLAIDWEPYELSVVPVPADSKATFLAAEPVAETIHTTGQPAQGDKMKPLETTGDGARVEPAVIATAAVPTVTKEETSAIALAAVQAERNRVSEI